MRFFGYLLFSLLLYSFFIGATQLNKDTINWLAIFLAYPLAIIICCGVVRLPIFRDYYQVNRQVIGSTLGSYHSSTEKRVAPLLVTLLVGLALWGILSLMLGRDIGIVAYCGGIAGCAFSWYFETK